MDLNWSNPHLLLIAFGAGILVKSLFAIKSSKDIIWWILGVIFGIFITFAGYREEGQGLFSVIPDEQFILTALFASAFGITIFLHKNLLPHIGEYTLLILTLIFLYTFAQHGLFYTFESPYLTLGILIPSIFIVCLAFLNIKIGSVLKLFFYFWFILLNLYFIAFYLFSEQLILWNYSQLNFNSPLDAFLIGFTAFTLIANLCFLIMLLPAKSKYQSWQMAAQRWQEYASLLIERHSDIQVNRYHALFILLIPGTFLIINYYYNFVSDGVLIPIFLILAQIDLTKKA